MPMLKLYIKIYHETSQALIEHNSTKDKSLCAILQPKSASLVNDTQSRYSNNTKPRSLHIDKHIS